MGIPFESKWQSECDNTCVRMQAYNGVWYYVCVSVNVRMEVRIQWKKIKYL